MTRPAVASHSTAPNELADRELRSPLEILKEQFVNPLVWLLLAAAIASVVLGDYVETIAILAIVILNAALGFFQEYRAENALASLRKLSEPYATVLRGREWRRIPAHELVPGDLVQLEAGNRVPADGRVLESAHLQVNEASLTGESLPVDKQGGRSLPKLNSRNDPTASISERLSRAVGASRSRRQPAWRPNWGASPACSSRSRRKKHPSRGDSPGWGCSSPSRPSVSLS